MTDVYPLEQELNLLDASEVRFRRNAFCELVLVTPEGRWDGVSVVRTFPYSAPERMLSVRDSAGREVGLVQDVGQLEPESRRLLYQELERLYFVPRITRVLRIDERFHVPCWEVETDRGPRAFEIRSGRRDVRVVDHGRVLIRDADGNAYEIPDYRKLDPASRAQVETQI
ncbi:MAG: DUF1854 domain-containing protein [Candidatus Latescibacterota bacterium]